MERYFEIAGSVVKVTGPDEDLFTDAGVLTDFETRGSRWDRWLHCALADQLPKPEGTLVHSSTDRVVYAHGDSLITYVGISPVNASNAYLRMERRGREIYVTGNRRTITGVIHAGAVLTAMDAVEMAVENEGIILHASCIAYEGSAILFTAPSGTGKSTQADLWKQFRGAQVINGDRMMVQVAGKECRCVGVPFAGSSGICKNKTLQLKAIVYLEQAPENSICQLHGVTAFRRIWEGCSIPVWNRKAVEQCMNTVTQIMDNVPVWCLRCTPDEAAVQTLEKVLA